MSDSSTNSWELTHVPKILHNPERYQQRRLRREKRKSLKKQRASRSRVRSHSRSHSRSRSKSRSRSRSRSKSIHSSNIPNTATNWENFDSNNYDNVRHGPSQKTAEKHLYQAITETEGYTTLKVRSHIKAILNKIAHRPKGDEYYPKNKLTVVAVENALVYAIRNTNAGDHHKPMSIAILDTLLTHPLFRNVQFQTFESNTKTYIMRPYDTVNMALLYAIRNTNDIRIIRFLVEEHGANPAADHCIAIIDALVHDKHRIIRGQKAEMENIIDYFMKQPSMRKWETMHQAIQYIKMRRTSADIKHYCISFFVVCMFSLLKDMSNKKTKEYIIFMHDTYREYMDKPEEDDINRLYSIVTQSLNKALPSSIHNLLSRYG
jgi:hypothetical protein